MALIIVFSDIHGNLPAVEAAWNDMRRRDFDALYCLGDLAAFGPWPDETITFIREEMKPTAVIAGNTDRYLLEKTWEGEDDPSDVQLALKWSRDQLSDENVKYLESLPAEHTETVEDVEIELLHGGPGDDEFGIGAGTDPERFDELFAEHGPGITFCGHTHVPFRKRHGERMIVNDGSIGFPFDGDRRACYVRAKLAAGRLNDFENRRVSYNTSRTARQLIECGIPYAEVLNKRLRFAEYVD